MSKSREQRLTTKEHEHIHSVHVSAFSGKTF